MVCVFSFTQMMAQTSNLVFFTEAGENFTLFVNGARQNATPAANVKAIGIKGDFVQIKVQFETSGTPELQQGMMLEAGMEMTAMIKKNNKGKYVFRPVSSVPLEQATESANTVATASQPAAAPTPVESSTVSTTTTTTAGPANTGNVGVNISDGQGGGFNMNVNVNVNDAQTQASQTTVVTTTTSSTTSSTSSPATSSPAASAPAASGSNCATPMSSSDFESAKKAINGKSFAEDKMIVSKQILKSNCVSVKQVKGIMELFSYEENKLEFAKLAYPKTVDKGNYYQVNDSFSFSGSITELNAFLESQD